MQIFDPRYYDDREAALRRLFGQAAFLVAPRDEHSAADLAALLGRPQNAPYAGRVRPASARPPAGAPLLDGGAGGGARG